MTEDLQTARLLDAILPHVAFDGWSEIALRAAAMDCDMTMADVRRLCPRGAVDLAVAFHRRGDEAMVQAVQAADLSGLRLRDRVAFALRARLDAVPDKEAVRRGTALFALPHLAGTGARLIWGTADRIWEVLGDPSRDVNWYTKRTTLASVYGSVVLYWLGDDSHDGQATDAFIARRIDDIMQIEKVKAALRGNRVIRPFLAPLDRLVSNVRAPAATPEAELPGRWTLPR